MLDLAAIQNCAELTSDHAKHAASSSTHMRALMEHFSVVARPGEGCPKILMALARLVGQDWVEGPLRVEIGGDDDATTLTVMCDFGAGIRERILPVTRFAVPFDEFYRAVELAPGLVLPLRISDEDGMMVLTPLLTREVPTASNAPPAFELDDQSLAEALRKTAPPPAPGPEDLEGGVHEVPTRPNLPRLRETDD